MASEFISAVSQSNDPSTAAGEVAGKLKAGDPGFVVFFVSSNLDYKAAGEALAEQLGDTPVIGCTTAGEISKEGFSEDSLVAMGVPGDIIDSASFGLIENIGGDTSGVGKELERMSGELGRNFNEDDCSDLLALVLIDGMSGSEENVMNELARHAFNLVFVGASAGDDLKFETTSVFMNGKEASNAAILAVLKLNRPFKIVKTQSFEVLKDVFTITKANEAERTVHEINGETAADVYARATGVDREMLAEKAFMSHPVGVMVDGEPYVRSPQQVLPDGSIKFYCNIKDGGTVNLLKSGDMVSDTDKAFEKAKEELGGVSGMLVFNCILRYLDAKARDITGEVGEIYGRAPSVGFNTYGEEYLAHINQTCTAVFFQ